MGTISGYSSRKDVVDDLVQQYTSERFSIIDRKATNFGRHLWMLIKPNQGPSFICLFKLSSYGGDWGYKEIDESMGPVYWDCPVSLLKQADCPTTESATEWRDEVYRLNGIHDYCDDYERTNDAMDALSESMNPPRNDAMGSVLSLVTCDGYVFFSSPDGWVDGLTPDGKPYQHDMLVPFETFQEWIEEGDARLYKWAPTWSPVFAGPFKRRKLAEDYRYENLERHQPTRIRSMVNRYDGATLWFIDRRKEVK